MYEGPLAFQFSFPCLFVADYTAATTHRHDEISLIFAILVIHYDYLHTQRKRHTQATCQNIPAPYNRNRQKRMREAAGVANC